MKMKKHTNIFQTQEEDKTSEKDLNETEINYLSDKEFKIMILKVRMEDKKRIHNKLRITTKRENITTYK